MNDPTMAALRQYVDECNRLKRASMFSLGVIVVLVITVAYLGYRLQVAGGTL